MLSATRLSTTPMLPAHAETAFHEIAADVTFVRLVLDEPAARPAIDQLDLINIATERMERAILALRATLFREVGHG